MPRVSSVVEALVVPAVPVPVAGAQAVVAQVEASAADVAGKDTDTLKIHILGGKKGICDSYGKVCRFCRKFRICTIGRRIEKLKN